MKRCPLPPDAPVLLEAMRAIGYDAATAIADLIDNSITASASEISIRFLPGRPDSLAILDNGCGLDAGELRLAMKYGSRSPRELRHSHDLGRFGLGLKTASMSQCRHLTVATRREGKLIGMEWDLDEVGPDWNVGELEEDDLAKVPYIKLLEQLPTGTLVVWRKLDILAGDDTGDGSVFGSRMAQVREHLALVFHRFLTRTTRPVRISVNNAPIVPVDPFLEALGSQHGPIELIDLGEAPISVQAFTLPHISKLTPQQIAAAGGDLGLRKKQGFYVYRNMRLIVWGTWFRLTRHAELTKLTRVRVDVPNSLDHFWRLDIKKSAASPPEIVRERLKELMPRLVTPSKLTTTFRARSPKERGVEPLWLKLEGRAGFSYGVNPAHPLISALRESAPSQFVSDIDSVLRALSESVPYDAIYHDMLKDTKLVRGQEDDSSVTGHLEDLARQLLGNFNDNRQGRDLMMAQLHCIEPFAHYPDLTAKLLERLASS